MPERSPYLTRPVLLLWRIPRSYEQPGPSTSQPMTSPSTSPALRLPSCVIGGKAAPMSPLFVWIQEPLECIGFLPRGEARGKHCPSFPSEPLALLSPRASFTRPAGFTPLIAHHTCAHNFDFTIEESCGRRFTA